MTDREEREAIVAFMRQPCWCNMSLWQRLEGAVRFFVHPEVVCGAVARNIALRIESGEHHKPNRDQAPT